MNRAKPFKFGDFMNREKDEKQKILRVFPREGRFKTMAELDAYFSGEKIQCLLCGKWFNALGPGHLPKIHGVAADEYKERFGIPLGRGLIGAKHREKSVIHGKKMFADGKLNPLVKGEGLPRKRKREKTRRPASFRGGRPVWRREEYEAIPERIRSRHRVLRDVCGDPDLPNYDSFVTFARKHPELREKVRRAHFTLPYWLQINGRETSPRFKKDCHRLRTGGMTNKNIAKALGVSVWTVSRALRSYNKETGIAPATPRVWHPRDFDAIIDRLRDRQLPLYVVCKDPDLPSLDEWKKHVKKHPDFSARLKKVIHTMPYSFQALVRKLSPRFAIDCQLLRTRRLTHKKIAKALGVAPDTVKHALRGFRKIRSTRQAPPPKWRREDYEAILDRIRSQQRTLKDVCQDPDLPSTPSWYLYVSDNPELNLKLHEIYDIMPYYLQGKARGLPPRFRLDCERLRSTGRTIENIAETLGVSLFPVVRILQDSKKKHA